MVIATAGFLLLALLMFALVLLSSSMFIRDSRAASALRLVLLHASAFAGRIVIRFLASGCGTIGTGEDFIVILLFWREV